MIYLVYIHIYIYIYIYLFDKEYRTMTSGWHGAQCFKIYGRMLASKPANSLKEELEAAELP